MRRRHCVMNYNDPTVQVTFTTLLRCLFHNSYILYSCRSCMFIMPLPRDIKWWCCLTSDVSRVHPVSGRRVWLASWMAHIGWSSPARPAWLKAAAARFRCKPGRGISWRPSAYILLCYCQLASIGMIWEYLSIFGTAISWSKIWWCYTN